MTDIIPLRYLYMPGNILINDWGLMQLFLLPFPLLLSIKLPQKYKIYPIIITFIGLYSLVLTFSRGTYIATTIFLLTLTIFSIVRKIKISTPVFIRASIILALFILLLIPIRHPVVQTLSMNSTHSQSKSLSGRFDQWKRCGEILTDNELFGIGSGSYKIANKIISNRDQIPYTKKVTNSYLQVFIEKGIVGSVLYTILAIAILYTLISKLRRQKNDDELLIIVTSLLIAVAVKEFTFSTLFDLPKTFFLFIIWSLLSDDKIFRKAQIKGYLPLSLLILLIPLYYLSFIRYSQVNNAYQINQKAVIASFEKNTFKLKLILSDIDPVRIKSPVILSNMALVNINDSDTIGYNSFAKGITVMTNNGNKLHNCISLLEQSVRLAPNEPTFLLNLGWLYIAQNDVNSAVNLFNKAIQLSPSNHQAQISLGLCQEALDDTMRAERYYTSAITQSPYVIESRFFKELKQRNVSLADKILHNSISILESDHSIDGQAKLSKIYFESGEMSKSKDIAISIINILPNLNRVWVTLGDLYVIDSNIDDAIKCYNKASILDIQDKVPLNRLYILYTNIGDIKHATYYKNACLKIKSPSENTNYFQTLYGCNSIYTETFPFGRNDYFLPEYNFDE